MLLLCLQPHPAPPPRRCRYLLWRLVCEEKMRVIYHYAKGDVPGAVFDADPTRTGRASFVIVDGTDPCKLPYSTHLPYVLISSPDTPHIFDQFQDDANYLYLPTPTVNEVLLMREVCYGGDAGWTGTIEDVLERIDRWGPVPHYTLYRVDTEKAEWKSTIAALSWREDIELVQLADGLTSYTAERLGCKLVHYDVEPSLKSVTYTWASEYTKHAVYKRLSSADPYRACLAMMKRAGKRG